MQSPTLNPSRILSSGRNYCPPKKQGITNQFSSTSAATQEFEMGESSSKQMGNNSRLLGSLQLPNLEQIIKEIQVRHQADKESLLNAIYELNEQPERNHRTTN
ncbi:hypothetical protein Tco_0242402 [Tanacetum coccineum]